jgi:hypothetical protein
MVAPCSINQPENDDPCTVIGFTLYDTEGTTHDQRTREVAILMHIIRHLPAQQT